MLSCSAILKIAARKINQAGTKNHPWDVCVHCPQERQRLEMVLQQIIQKQFDMSQFIILQCIQHSHSLSFLCSTKL